MIERGCFGQVLVRPFGKTILNQLNWNLRVGLGAKSCVWMCETGRALNFHIQGLSGDKKCKSVSKNREATCMSNGEVVSLQATDSCGSSWSSFVAQFRRTLRVYMEQ